MNTDDFVALLATGPQAIESGTTRHRHVRALACGGIVAMGLMMVFLGVRKDIAQAIYVPMFWIKLLFPLSMAGIALLGSLRLSQPGVRLGHVPQALAVPVAVLWMLAAVMVYAAPPGERSALWFGQTWAMCPILITMLSLPTFAGTFWAMKGGAPTRPALAGANAGLLASTTATVIYALHCPEMAPPFLATWYLLGMLIPTAAGAMLGARYLRW